MTNVARTNMNGHRPSSDLYSTPHEATHPFVLFEMEALRAAVANDCIWEPAAGEGWIAQVLEIHGFDVIETDKFIHHRARNQPVEQLDFFTAMTVRAPVIITNPPYLDINAFIRHALMLEPIYAAFFLPVTFLAGKRRRDLRDAVVGGCKLARVLTLEFRVTLKPTKLKLKNTGVVTYAWFVWVRGHTGPSVNYSLPRAAEMTATDEMRRAA